MDNPWFVRIIALSLALLLFFSVNHDMNKNNNQSRPNGMENNEVETIVDVPVEVYYDSENLVVNGIPNTVDVTIEGQRRFVEAAKRQRDFTVFVDLSNVSIGDRRVPILYKDFSDKLKVKIEPAYAEVSIQEKVTEEFTVEAEFNNNTLAEGFEADSPVVDPKTVQITGGKETIEKISYVKASIDAGGLITHSLKQDTKVTVLDRHLNKLDVFVDPEFVTVTVPVNNPRKTVPLKIKQTGTPPNSTIIKRIETDINEVIVYGRTKVLEQLKELELEVDVSKIDKTTELELPLTHPAGVNKTTPEKVKVKIVAEKNSEETSLNIPIESKGLAEGLDMEILAPAEGAVSIKLEGNSEELKKAVEKDFEVFMNMEGLKAGEHELDLQVSGPQDVKWQLSTEKAKVRLKERENA